MKFNYWNIIKFYIVQIIESNNNENELYKYFHKILKSIKSIFLNEG